MKNDKILLLITLLSVLLVFGVGTYYYKTYDSLQVQSDGKMQSALIRDYSFKEGNPSAKVKLVEFFDPACGTCAQFYPYIKEILKEKNPNVELILRYAPFHENSLEVVKILEASKNQNLYLETLEYLFSTQSYWVEHHVVNVEKVWKLLENLWIDLDKLKSDAKSTEVQKRVTQDMEDAKALHVNKTPSYFVNGKPLEKFGLKELYELIESEL